MNDNAVRPDGRAIRPDGVAQMLDISRAKVYELLAAGELPSFTIGRVRLVLVKDVEDYVMRLREQAAAPVPDEPRAGV
jgi:excisionase family DNA binding protein